MRDRAMNLTKYGITRERALELKWLARQYDQLRRLDPWAADRLRLIEQSAREADPGIWRHLIKNACQMIPYERMDAPCSWSYFTERKRRFYIILDRKTRLGQ